MRIGDITNINAAIQAINRHQLIGFRKAARHAKAHAHQASARCIAAGLLGCKFGFIVDIARNRRQVFSDPHRTILCNHRGAIHRGTTGVHKSPDTLFQRGIQKALGATHVRFYKFLIRLDAYVRRMQSRCVDHAIDTGDKPINERGIIDTADMSGERPSDDIEPDNVMFC